MNIILVGVSHKTAPVELRERLVFAEDRLTAALGEMVDREAIEEGLIISTCNRVEIIAAGTHAPDSSVAHLYDFLSRYHDCPTETLHRHSYHHTDLDAIKHVFRVASSLDSMVVGEPQITGQVKEAFQRAQEARTVGDMLHRLMSRAFAVAKRVRNETGIGSSAVSISFVAVELARKVFERLDGSTIMLVGAGEMAELAARHLGNYGATRLLIANRTLENAERLAAEMKGRAIPFGDFEQHLGEADIIICSTGTPNYLIRPEAVRAALEARRNRPMLLIDISVPRNIDPAAAAIDNVFVFDIDDLENVVATNQREREREALRAEAIIEAEADRFLAMLAEGDLNQVIGAFRREVGLMVQVEIERSRKKLGDLTPEQEQALRTLLNSVVNKLTMPVIKQLRESEDGHSRYLESWRELYPHRDVK
jgi:glutamyl-tRNA reductase